MPHVYGTCLYTHLYARLCTQGKAGPGFGNTNTEPVAFELMDEVGALGDADAAAVVLKPGVDPAYVRKPRPEDEGAAAADAGMEARPTKYPPTYIVARKMQQGQTDVSGLSLPVDLPEGHYTLAIKDASGCPFLKEAEQIRPCEIKLTCTKGWKWKDGKPIDPALDTGKKK